MSTQPRVPPTLAPRAGTPSAPPGLPPHGLAPDTARDTGPAPPRRKRPWLRALLWTLLALVLLGLVPPATVLALRWLPPPTTAFMLQSPVKPVHYQWVPATKIPEPLRKAVIAAEDQKFRTHWGFDFIAIAEALEHNEKSRRKRGASTITQQTAKNLFLWPSRSWLRKGLEVSFTLMLEAFWTKDRILEVYLNIAEFGPGIFGVEAAAQKLFRKSADQLTPQECARLAAVLPNPRKWHAERPGPYVQSRVDWILAHIGYGPPPTAFPEELPGEMPLEPAPADDLAEPASPEEDFLADPDGPATRAPAAATPEPTPEESPPEESPDAEPTLEDPSAPAASSPPQEPSERPPPEQRPSQPQSDPGQMD